MPDTGKLRAATYYTRLDRAENSTGVEMGDPWYWPVRHPKVQSFAGWVSNLVEVPSPDIAMCPKVVYPPWEFEQFPVELNVVQIVPKEHDPLLLVSLARELIGGRYRDLWKVYTDGSMLKGHTDGGYFDAFCRPAQRFCIVLYLGLHRQTHSCIGTAPP